jgi:hypothetical protein
MTVSSSLQSVCCSKKWTIITYFDLRRRGSRGPAWHVWSGWNTWNRKVIITRYLKVIQHTHQRKQKQAEMRSWKNKENHTFWNFLFVWSSGHSSWRQIQRSGFDSRRYQMFWEVVGLERGPLSLVSTTEELLGRKTSGSGLENREYGRRNPSNWPRDTLYPQTLVQTSHTSGGRSVGTDRSRTQATEFVFHFDYRVTRWHERRSLTGVEKNKESGCDIIPAIVWQTEKQTSSTIDNNLVEIPDGRCQSLQNILRRVV